MSEPETTERLRVLLVDDEAAIRVLLAIALPDVELVEAASAAAALEVLGRGRPDAIVVDRRLPDGDGLDFVRHVRRRFTTSRTPIVVVTAGHDEADRAEVTRAGADRYLAKPVDPDALVAELRSVLDVAPADRRERRAAAARGETDLGHGDGGVRGDGRGARPSR